ncbi:MAG: TRAP transporter large permease [Cohaesibacteraceae bacterium]|nr:TRAP transporter large permease [Cohaesibacteraceae bacterium]
MSNLELGALFTSILLVFVLLGIRVAFAAGLVGFFGLVVYFSQKMGFEKGVVVAIKMAGTIPHSKSVFYALSLIPTFILIGFLAFHAGLTKKLFDAAKKWLGWMPGGMAVATIFATAGFAAVSGASVATAAVFARVAIPEMLAEGYSKRLAAGVVAAGGTLATLIPPSTILVIYAIIVEQSVGQLLVAGFLPGIASAFIYGIIIVVFAKWGKEAAPAVRGFTWHQRFSSLPGTIPIFVVVFIIFGSLFFGLATPTEAGSLGAFVLLLIALAKGMRWPQLSDALNETARLTVMIFTIIWGVLLYVRFLGFVGLPEAFSDFIAAIDQPPLVTLLLILCAYAVLGMFMDAIGMLLLTLPVVYPAVMGLGYDPIWFGIIVVKMAELCLITPPIGLNCFVVAGVRPDIPVQEVFKGATPFFLADVITIGVLIAFPAIVTWLPSLMFKIN